MAATRAAGQGTLIASVQKVTVKIARTITPAYRMTSRAATLPEAGVKSWPEFVEEMEDWMEEICIFLLIFRFFIPYIFRCLLLFYEDLVQVSIDHPFALDSLPIRFSESSDETQKQANKPVELIRDHCGYRFAYKDQCKCISSVSYWFYCCQDSSLQRNKGTEQAQRDRRQMKRFACHGNLKLKVDMESRLLHFVLKHKHHPSYVNLDLSDEAFAFIVDRIASRTPAEIYRDLLAQKVYGFENVTQPQVYYWWRKANQQLWQRDPDQFVSARVLLQEQSNVKASKFQHGNVRGLAFYINDTVQKLVNVTVEVAIDPTFGTNNAGMDLYAVLAEVDGSGIPLAYLFLQTVLDKKDDKQRKKKKNSDPGATTAILRQFLTLLKDRSLRPSFFDCDKDLAELSAIKSVFPESTIQLCYWHAKRAVKVKMSDSTKTKTQSRYRPEEAQKLVPHLEICWGSAPNQRPDGPHRYETFDCKNRVEFAEKDRLEALSRQDKDGILDLFSRHLNMHPFCQMREVPFTMRKQSTGSA